LSVSE